LQSGYNRSVCTSLLRKHLLIEFEDNSSVVYKCLAEH